MEITRKSGQLPQEMKTGLRKADASRTINTVVRYFGLTRELIESRKRDRHIVDARHIIHYLLSHKDISNSKVGMFTRRDPATVLHSFRTVEDLMETDTSFYKKIVEIVGRINRYTEQVQIIGKVTGLEREEVVDKFFESERKLSEAGYDVVNPVAIIATGTAWHDAMRICLKSLLEVDAIAVQPDWQESKGARCEYHMATALNLKIIWL